MSSYKIDSIDIKAVRGIIDVTIPVEGKNILIKGETGTGKSSIIDALDYFFTGKIAYFVGQAYSLKKDLPNKKYSYNDVKVKLEFNPGRIEVERTADQPISVPKGMTKYFDGANKGSMILRRAQILKFIVDKPSERFQAISDIIGLDSIDEIEKIMMQTDKSIETEIIVIFGEIESAYSYISDQLGTSVKDIKSILDGVNVILDFFKFNKITELSKLPSVVESLKGQFEDKTDRDVLLKHSQIQDIVTKSNFHKTIDEDIKILNGYIEEIKSNQELQRKIIYNQLYKSGLNILKKSEDNICPLCEQIVDNKVLIDRIENRIKDIKMYEETNKNIESISVKISNDSIRQLDILKDLESKCLAFNNSPIILEQIDAIKQKLDSLVSEIKQLQSGQFEKTITPIIDMPQKIEDLYSLILTENTPILDSLSPSPDKKTNIDKYTIITNILRDVMQLPLKENKLDKLSKEKTISSNIYSMFTESKKEKIDTIYSEIEKDINSYYSILHKDDPHKDITVKLDPKRRASTNITIKSFDQYEEDPKALISEGHQDSLGLCIFLAFTRHFNKGCNFIVLDDVVTTIDMQHRRKICQLLNEYFSDYQIMITTHDDIWYEDILERCNNFISYEIIRWNESEGVVINSYKDIWEKIKFYISQSDMIASGNGSRQYTEWIFNEIGEMTGSRVPLRRNNKYTLEETLTSVSSRLNELLEPSPYKDKINILLKNIKESKYISNLTSHDNKLEIALLSIKDIEEFSNYVHQLHQAFICPDCGKILKYYNDRKRICCKNNDCRSKFEIYCK